MQQLQSPRNKDLTTNYQNVSLQRSASPNMKLIIFTNLDLSESQIQRSFRVRDNTTLFDLEIYLQQFHSNCNLSFYTSKRIPIKEHKNTYVTNLFHYFANSVVNYRASNKTESLIQQDVPDDDEPIGLQGKLKDSSFFKPSMSERNKEIHSQPISQQMEAQFQALQINQQEQVDRKIYTQQNNREINTQNKKQDKEYQVTIEMPNQTEVQFLNSKTNSTQALSEDQNNDFEKQYPLINQREQVDRKIYTQQTSRAMKTENQRQDKKEYAVTNEIPNQSEAKFKHSMNTNSTKTQSEDQGNVFEQQQSQSNSMITFKCITCKCGKEYNSQELRKIIDDSIEKKQYALCKSCKKEIQRSMYFKLELIGPIYDQLVLQIQLQKLIIDQTEFQQKADLRVASCIKNCLFKCIWNRQLQKSLNQEKSFCPNCLCQSVSNPF